MGDLLKSFEIKNNGNTVKIEIFEGEEGAVIKVIGDVEEIKVNEIVVHSTAGASEHKLIPPNLRPFIDKFVSSREANIEVLEEQINCSVVLLGTEYLLEIPRDYGKNSYIRIADWLENYSKIEEHGVKIESGRANQDALVKKIEKLGYKFRYFVDGNTFDDVYELLIPVNDFDANKLIKCLRLWSKYNVSLNDYISKVKF